MRLKAFLVKVFTVLVVFGAKAQLFDPVSWTTSVEQTEEGEVFLVSTATIDEGWHVYSQFVDEGGPIPTTFKYPNAVKLIGKTTEGEGIEVDDPNFMMRVKYFGNTAVFKQQIQLQTKTNELKATVEFMVCNDEMCLPPNEADLVFDVKDITEEKESKSYWGIFIISFLAGLTALITPCVFPMIPMTVSFFTKQSGSRAKGISNAVFYGVSIVVIYVLLGTIIVTVFGANALNELSTSVTFNIIFFVILVVFAFAFLGAYELVLPSSWGTKLDEKADKGGLIGIFFMAMALAVVSFSCTGPIVGTALVESASQGGIGPIISMLGFSAAIAIPFTLFAVFPGLLNSLPKSGGWLNAVKVTLGFLELALAFKFLSNADLVSQAHLLERELFIAIWVGVFLLLTLYLLGAFRLPHDYQPVEKLTVTRTMFATVALVFTLYLIPGIFGAPVKLVGAFVPPLDYSESITGFTKGTNATSSLHDNDVPDGAHILQPYNILSFNDYDKGLAYAQKVNKPVLLDFTGRACVNCRKMEQNVWIEPEILNILQNKVVLISLYVDERTSFDKTEVSPLTGKPYRYKGQKWAHFQEIRYKTNAQPYYAVLTSEGEDVSSPVGYTPNAKAYLTWLQQGIENAQ